jgi:hypothetical protein
VRESEDFDVECGIERKFEKDLGTKRKLEKEGGDSLKNSPRAREKRERLDFILWEQSIILDDGRPRF